MLARKLGEKHNLSFGTAAVFDGPHADPSKWNNLMYVNVRTLFRNYVASYDPKDYPRIDNEEFNQLFLDEVAEFERLVKEVTNNRVKTIFYYPKYDNLNKILPHLERDRYNPSIFDDVEENLWHEIITNKKWTPFNIEIIDEKGFEQSFSSYRDFENTKTIDQVQDELCKEIINDLVGQIYNATVANW